jgi:hypothetical protein
MNKKYLIPYPYTVTIAVLLVVCAVFISVYPMEWVKYLNVLAFTLLFGLAQINELENTGNEPAWLFPKGSSYFQDKNIKFYKNIIIEDVLFIPVCATLFYGFMAVTNNVPDFISRNSFFISYGLASILIIEAILYSYGGLSARNLINMYTLFPLIILLICGYDFGKANITHLSLSLLYVIFINCTWEIFNCWRGHWYYNKNCNLLGEKGWILKDKLHVSIFFQYPISGFVVMAFCWHYFG